jgi:hypothetical protein
VLGASRVAALSALLNPLIWAIVQRRRTVLLVAIIAAASLLVASNYSAEFYDSLPAGTRRSLSRFVVIRDVEEHGITADSDVYHFMLLRSGRSRWTQDLVSFTFGGKVEGWDEQFRMQTSVEQLADVAARLQSYENAFFTVTATLGIVGLLLFTRAVYWLYRPFTRNILRKGIRNQNDALAYVAVQSLVIYVGFSWIAGGYPSGQVVLGTLAAVSFYDRGNALPKVLDRSMVGSAGASSFGPMKPSVLGRGGA